MWGFLTIIFIALAGFTGYTSINNITTMNNLINQGTSIIKKENSLEELDIGEYKTVLIYKVLPFKSQVYYIDGIGVLAIMTLNLGIMEQFTLNINPFEKDLAQLTIDYIIAFRTRKLRVEIYELMVNKEDTSYKNFLQKIGDINAKYSALEDIPLSETWHTEYMPASILKSGGAKDDKIFSDLFTEVMEAYMDYAKGVSTLSKEDQNKKYEAIKGFSDLLVEKGGIAINNFKKSIGDEKTKEFLGKVLYGYLHAKQ